MEEYQNNFYEWSQFDQDIIVDEDKQSLLKSNNQFVAYDNIQKTDLEMKMLVPNQNSIRKQQNCLNDDSEKVKQLPNPLLQNKPFAEKMFGNCCVPSNDINKRELKFFKKFQVLMVKEYDQQNPDHEYSLKQLYEKLFQCVDVPSDENLDNYTMINDNWKNIGFQSRNPRTDFRGGGYLSLQCLIYMQEHYPRELQEMIHTTQQQHEYMWLTAVSSINITHNLIIYFYLNNGNVAPHQNKLRAGRSQFKKFCRLNYICKKTFFELNCFGLRFLYKTWIELVKKHGIGNIHKTLGCFNDCMHLTKQAIHNLLDEQILDFAKMLDKMEIILKNKFPQES